MNSRKRLFISLKLLALFVPILFLAGCTVGSIDSVFHEATVSTGQQITIQVSATKSGGGNPVYGYLAILVPTDWAVTGVDYDHASMVVADEVIPDPASTPAGFVWSIWRTASYYAGGAIQNPAVVHATVGINTGSFGLHYFAGMSTCDVDITNCQTVGWTASASSVITVMPAVVPSGLSPITVTPQTEEATISWTTMNVPASSKVVYSEDTSLGLFVGTTDTSTLSVSHGISLTGLTRCTSYYFKVVSKDAYGNTATSSERSFTTAGCRGGGSPVAMMVLPKAFAESTALGFSINNDNPITDKPLLTLTLNGDLSVTTGYAVSLDKNFTNESIQPYSQRAFFTLPKDPGTYTVYLKYYSVTGNTSPTIARTIILQTTTAETKSGEFARTLRLGDGGGDVKRLQTYLNTHGFTLAAVGPGSPGKETDLYGRATVTAVARFQEANADTILKPLQLKRGSGIFGPSTRQVLNNLVY